MTDYYIEVTANFVIPAGTEDPFINMLARAVDEHVFPLIITQEFYYYGIWMEEWLQDPPTPEEAHVFSLGLSKENVLAVVLDDVIVEIESSHVRSPSPSVDLTTEDVIKAFYQGYMDGFEAGGGDLVDALANDLLEQLQIRVAEKFSREKSVDDSSEAVDPS